MEKRKLILLQLVVSCYLFGIVCVNCVAIARNHKLQYLRDAIHDIYSQL